jgi:hypothetical protein
MAEPKASGSANLRPAPLPASGGSPETGAGAGERPSRGPGLVAAGAMVTGALCLAGTALIHLHLWMNGYRDIASIGAMFLLQALTGFALAVAVALWHRWYVAAAGALFLLATAGGLVISAERGLFGFKDSLGAPYAGLSLVVEVGGAAALALAALLALRRNRRV